MSTKTMTEQWLSVKGYPAYEVSDLGRVRSYYAHGPRRICDAPQRALKPSDDLDGYQIVTLCANGKRATRRVHGLVAEAFLGPRPEGLQVNHEDTVKHNNAAANLTWMTQQENIAHAARMGLMPRGEQNGQSKLTAVQVIEMRRLHALGRTQRELGKIFGTHRSNVGHIVNFVTWKHVKKGEAACRTLMS